MTFDEQKKEFIAMADKFRDSAFPVTVTLEYTSKPGVAYQATSKGLSKREYFAGKAMAGMLANADGVNRVFSGIRKAIPEMSVEDARVETINQIAISAVDQADSLIKKLAEP